MDSSSDQIVKEIPGLIRVFKDGRFQKLMGTDTVPAGTDPSSGVQSKDVVISPETNISARLYLPKTDIKKLPLLIFYHGGGFITQTAASPLYHTFLNLVASESNVVIVSVDYRTAPEFPVPICYDDSWEAINWVAQHVNRNGPEPWLNDHADLQHVYFVGDSAGANIAHHMAIRFGTEKPGVSINLRGIVLLHPAFWGKDRIGSESEHPWSEASGDIWLFACPETSGLDDPLMNPAMDPKVSDLGCSRILVFVAEKDLMKDRGWYYKEILGKSGWCGDVEVIEDEGEDHVFFLFNPSAANMSQHSGKQTSSATNMSSNFKDSSSTDTKRSHSSVDIDAGMKHNIPDVSKQEEITLIGQLDGYKDNLLIKVRILHLWYMPDNSDPKKLFAIELILMDEEGTKIQARVMNKFTEKYRNVLQLDTAYYIKNLGFVANRGVFLPTENNEKLSFQYDTKVSACHDFKGSKHGFNFVECDDIFANLIPSTKAIDFIGEVIEVGVLKDDNADRARHNIKLMLENLKGNKINSCLWGDNAHKMHQFYQSKKDDTRVILIIQFARVSCFGGVVSVESYYQTSRTFINEDVAEIKEFRNRLVPRDNLQTTSASSRSSLRSLRTVSEEQDFLENNPHKFVSDITFDEPCIFVLIGTIRGIVQNKSWYFLSCTGCLKAVAEKADQCTRDASDRPFTFNGVVYECRNGNCKAPSRYVNPRFRIPVIVKDDTGEVKLTLFDGPAVKLIKQSCRSVITKTLKKGLDVTYFPSEVKDLETKKMCFKVEIKPYNIENREEYFGVSRISTNEDIMAKLELGCDDDQDDTYDFGKAVSHTDENVSPTSPVQLNSNVRDYDTIEDVEGFSANKKRRSNIDEGEKENLIKVKLEKDMQ